MATQAESIANWAVSMKGKTSYKGQTLVGYCLRFVSLAYKEGGGFPYVYAGTAKHAGDLYIHDAGKNNKSNIPLAAAVFFLPNHIGVHVGGGMVAHAYSTKGVIIESLQNVLKRSGYNSNKQLERYQYRGWGFLGEHKPSGADDGSSYVGDVGSTAYSSTGAIDHPTAPERKEITTVVIRSIDGKSYVQNRQVGELEHAKVGPEIMIQSDKVYVPCLVDEITLDRPRKGGPAKLTFTVVKDEVLSFFEGNPVSFTWNGKKLFFGFVFTKSRTDLTTIQVTAYDQLRYLKAKDTLSYANKTYAQLVQMLADDYGLQCGELEDTGYQIPARIEETTLLDMLGNASDETVLHTGKLFVLYDDYGRLQLKSLASMRLPLMLDGDTVESFDYKSSIDSDVYTKVKLASDNSTTGERETYITNDEGNQARWSILQYYQKLSVEANAGMLQDMAKAVLTHYGTRNRTLRISGALGDIRVRGGSLLLAVLGLGDLNMRNVMLVENVKHHFKEGVHTMDLTLSGRIGEGDEVFSA